MGNSSEESTSLLEDDQQTQLEKDRIELRNLEEVKPVEGYQGKCKNLGKNRKKNISRRLKEGKPQLPLLIKSFPRVCEIRFGSRKHD